MKNNIIAAWVATSALCLSGCAMLLPPMNPQAVQAGFKRYNHPIYLPNHFKILRGSEYRCSSPVIFAGQFLDLLDKKKPPVTLMMRWDPIPETNAYNFISPISRPDQTLTAAQKTRIERDAPTLTKRVFSKMCRVEKTDYTLQ